MTAPDKLIVTGHLGFIASAFCELYHKRYKIVGVDFAGWGAMLANLASDIDDRRIDIRDAGAVSALMDEVRPDAIINFAAESHVDRSIENDLPFWTSNVLGARNLALEASRRGLRMVQVSTDEVYGEAADSAPPWVETCVLAPRNPYAASKAAAELMLVGYHYTLGLDVVISRGANTIGPRQFPEKAVPKAITCFLSGNPFPLFRTPARRMWMHVDDHARGVHAVLERGRAPGAYNLAPGLESEAYTSDVIARVREIVGGGVIEEVDDRKGYDLRYLMSADRAERELGWQPEYDLDATLEKTVRWYLDNQDWLDEANKRLQ